MSMTFALLVLNALLFACVALPYDNKELDTKLQGTSLKTDNGFLPESINQLLPLLDDSQYIGVFPEEQSEDINLPGDQPQTCPSATGSSYPRTPINLGSICPWIWEMIDLGINTYPRYVKQAKCLCQNCMDFGAGKCHEQRWEMPILRRIQSSENGLAVMQRDAVVITTNCFCAAKQASAQGLPHLTS